MCPTFNVWEMKSSDIISQRIKEIAKTYIIPTNIEPILRNALTVKLDFENSFKDSEKESISYQRVESSIDSHIAGILMNCFARNKDWNLFGKAYSFF